MVKLMNNLFLRKVLDKLDLSFSNKISLVHQTESSECGLACLSMICSYYGKNIDLISLRQQFNLSTRGTTLANLIKIGEHLGLASRPLSLDLDDLKNLRVPCILHWEFNHFVVLVSIKRKGIIILDPDQGRRFVKLEDMSKSFTGIALEVWPNTTFTKNTIKNKINLKKLINNIHGLKKSLTKLFFLSIVIEFINLLLPIGTQLVMDHAIPAHDLGLLSLICIALIIFILLRTIIGSIRVWSSLVMSTLISIQWQFGLLNHLLNLPLSFFERRKLGDIQSRFDSLNTLRETFTGSLVGALMDITMLIGVTVMMILYGKELTWFVIGFTLFYLLIRLLTYNIYRDLTKESLIRDARTRSFFMETLYGIATVKMQGMIERRSINWLNLEIDSTNTEIKITKMDFIYNGLNSIIGALEHVVILWLGANFIIENKMTIGMFMAFSIFREQFVDRVFSLTNFVFQLKMISLHNERISDIALNLQEETKNEIKTINKSMLPISIKTLDLSFRYDNQSEKIFENLNINIQPGENIAIIGKSGCGKTTLMKVLCGLLLPSSGKVLVDGIDITEIGVNNYRKMIGCVMQEDKLFSGSIRENICGFNEIIDEDWMIECAKLSFCNSFIEKMPMKYDTLIGELGEGLSGGQKQRIFIARALYRKPSIIFLDEATSALDNDSELYVNEAIKHLNITRIIIAHRETTIASADRIIKLN